MYAHASVGCLHVRPVINLKTEEGLQRFETIAEEVSDLVLKYGGAISGEHGDGLVRSPFQEKMVGPDLYQAFRELKATFDPAGLFNPGKIVDAPPLTANLRYGPGYVTPTLATTFDFSADGGVLQAAELCAGVGACRKKRDGTMCPSFQATHDEKDSTRGRANLLRMAITGQLGFDGFTDPHLREVLDLCLECKACKSECPTNVDMARLKAEFLDQFHREHGVPAQPRIRPRGRSGTDRLQARPGVELVGRPRLAPLAERKAPGNRPQAPAPTVCPPDLLAAIRLPRRPRASRPGQVQRRSSFASPALSRHVHQLLPTRNRQGCRRRAPPRGL